MDRSKQRMTFSLPKDLVQRLKAFAEKRGKPMSGLILQIIEDAVGMHDLDSPREAGAFRRGGRSRRKGLKPLATAQRRASPLQPRVRRDEPAAPSLLRSILLF